MRTPDQIIAEVEATIKVRDALTASLNKVEWLSLHGLTSITDGQTEC